MKTDPWKRTAVVMLSLFLPVLLVLGCGGKKAEKGETPFFDKWKARVEQGHSPEGSFVDESIPEDAVPLPVEQVEQVGKSEKNGKNQREEPKPQKRSLPEIPVSMKMYDVDVGVLFRALARAANQNIILSENVKGQVTVNVQKVQWSQVFKSVLKTHGLLYAWEGGILRIFSKADIDKEQAIVAADRKQEFSKKEYELKLLNLEQKLEEKKQAMDRSKKAREPLITWVYHVKYADPVTLRDNLDTFFSQGTTRSTPGTDSAGGERSSRKESGGSVETQTSPARGGILVNPHTNSLVIQASRSKVKRLQKTLEKLDRPTSQVLIEAYIVEANSDTARQLGIQWGGLGLNTAGGYNNWIGGPLPQFESSVTDSDGQPVVHLPDVGNIFNFATDASETGAGMNLGLMYENIGKNILMVELSALEEEGKLNILSNPSITTMDNQVATIESGRDVPFQTVEDGEVNIEFKKAAINLEVTPHVIDKTTLKLGINTSKDELDWSNTVNGNPTIIKKEAETTVVLFDGQTTVIGGLSKEKTSKGESGVPWLRDVPVVGTLFKGTSNKEEKEELLIFITPRILKGRKVKPAGSETGRRSETWQESREKDGLKAP